MSIIESIFNKHIGVVAELCMKSALYDDGSICLICLMIYQLFMGYLMLKFYLFV